MLFFVVVPVSIVELVAAVGTIAEVVVALHDLLYILLEMNKMNWFVVSKRLARSLKKILEYRIILGVDETVAGVVERRLIFVLVEKLRDVVVDHVMNDSIKEIIHIK